MKSILKVKKIKTKLIALLLLLIAFAGITISSIFIRHFYITTKQNIAPIYRPLRMMGHFW